MTNTPPADLVLLTDRRYTAPVAAADDWYLGNILRDDGLLLDALARLGLSAVRLDWSNPDVDWSRYRAAVFRSTWDYFDRYPQFTAWVEHAATQTSLCNPAPVVRWNADKHYLADLDARGIAVVPCRYWERGSDVRLTDLMAATGWTDAIVKPCVSGAARHTYRVNADTVADVEAVVRPLLAGESFILQPFQRDIQAAGEVSLMVFDGRYSHAVRKVAKRGDFRVQDDFGGTVHEHRPEPELIELAEQAAAACAPLPAYARVDVVRDNDGRPVVMELELIEPELWLRLHPSAADAFAAAIARRLP